MNKNTHYYSQHGEDYLISELFKNKNDGIFVEVGCVDGRKFSNTLHLAEKGWVGVCVEPHPDYVEKLKKNRKESEIFSCAAGKADNRKVNFYAEKRDFVSSLLSPGERNRFQNKNFKKIGVKQKKLNTILEESMFDRFNLLSVDVEGAELEVFKGFTPERFNFDVIVFEDNPNISNLNKIKMELGENYYYKFRIAQNHFFINNNFKIPNLDLNSEFDLISTEHPVDSDGDTIFTNYTANIEVFNDNDPQ